MRKRTMVRLDLFSLALLALILLALLGQARARARERRDGRDTAPPAHTYAHTHADAGLVAGRESASPGE